MIRNIQRLRLLNYYSDTISAIIQIILISSAELIKFLNEIVDMKKDFSSEREKSRELALNVAEN